ncbi:MAG: gamma-glutamyl-gamma-aminobutyrate hydrolase family protein [Verrucomicrobiota bacterium]
MNKAPLILVSPSTQRHGAEFSDASISLSNRYTEAIIEAGGVPVIIPCTASKDLVAEYIRRSDGVMLTGGEDVQPNIYSPILSEKLAKMIGPVEPERDVLELQMVDEVFRQHKPLLAICRGHQILNIALGGTMIVDIPTEISGAMNHRRTDRKNEKVHEVALTPDSLLAKITGARTLGVNSTHHQAVGRAAKPLRITAKSSDGIVEAMELKTPGLLPYLLAVQFHPERLVDRYKEFLQIFRSFVYSCASAKKI